MAKEPDIWMPLYVNSYFGKTRHLSTIEHGAYMLLLMTYWKLQGPLPDDDVRLARYAAMPLKQWKRIRPNVAEFFQIGNGQWLSTRSELEIFNAKKRSSSASANALKRYETDNATAPVPQSGRSAVVPAEPLPNGCSSPSPSPEDKKESISFASQTRVIEAQAILFAEPEPDIENQIDPKNWPRINGASKEAVVDALFERWFWPRYPERKGPKKPAKLAFRRAIKVDTADEILVGENRYFAKREDVPDGKQYTAHAVTWLNQHRWKDEIREMNAELGIEDNG